MGTFLALLGIRIGRALASWGLGSAGSGAAPVVVARPGCMHIEVGDTAEMAITLGDTAALDLTLGDCASMTIEIGDC